MFVYLRNDGSSPLQITDLAYEGIKLSEGLGRSKDRQSAVDLPGYSIFLSKLPKEQIDRLQQAGEPVWWKAEPKVLPPGGYGEVALRLRREPGPDSSGRLTVITDAGEAETAVKFGRNQTRFSGIYYHPRLAYANIYIKHPAGSKVEKLFVDGTDVTQSAKIGSDPALGFTAAVYRPAQPFGKMSYHCFRALLSDGSSATAGSRAFGGDFVYGMWGAAGNARTFYENLARHNVNVQMGHAPKDVTEMSLSDEGFEFLSKLGIRNMATWPGNARKPVFYFLMDEPDAHDPEIDDLSSMTHLGCLAQGLPGRMEQMRSKDPETPILLNVDNTYTPDNWYTYSQIADIASIDPYYPEQIDGVYRKRPSLMATRVKPTYVYAATRITQSSAAPKPVHTILCSTRYVPKDWKPGDYQGRFPTPEEKRIEVYYALAAGAKGISYWWFSPDAECVGCGVDEPAAMALWKEIGILGAEVRTAGNLITVSCPADLEIKAPRNIAARALVSGLETVALIAVNEEILSDRAGTVVKPVNAALRMRLPAWLNPADAFEITADGVKSVQWKKDGDYAALELGIVQLNRFVLITADPGLRGELEQLYKNKFAANVAALTGGP